jgi:hypothetical protein
MDLEKYMLPCMNKKLFGMECMGCGIQRSLAMILDGRFVDAFHMYPAIYPLMLFFVFIGLNIIDKSRSYHKLILITGIVTSVFMTASYLFKVFNH